MRDPDGAAALSRDRRGLSFDYDEVQDAHQLATAAPVRFRLGRDPAPGADRDVPLPGRHALLVLTQPTVSKLAEDRALQLEHEPDWVHAELRGLTPHK